MVRLRLTHGGSLSPSPRRARPFLVHFGSIASVPQQRNELLLYLEAHSGHQGRARTLASIPPCFFFSSSPPHSVLLALKKPPLNPLNKQANNRPMEWTTAFPSTMQLSSPTQWTLLSSPPSPTPSASRLIPLPMPLNTTSRQSMTTSCKVATRSTRRVRRTATRRSATASE